MLSHRKILHLSLGWLTVLGGIGCTALVLFAVGKTPILEARLAPIPAQQRIPWHFITQEDIENGVTVPADTHVAFHLPDSFVTIDRRVLFGRQGEKVRYWGYCLPDNYDPEVAKRRAGLPGLLFLSEAEREIREQQELPPEKRFSVRYPPTRREDLDKQKRKPPLIRHQFDTFEQSQLCYIMTASSLPMGLDSDNDGLNTKFEQQLGTHPDIADSDGDGLLDGIEHFYGSKPFAHHLSGERAGLNPLSRDTDVDGIIDGVEDKNRDGKLDDDETDPRKKDTDRDGLCDGLCITRIGRATKLLLGEDTNLNGKLDQNETDPLKEDSNGDGVTDFQAYFNCEAGLQEYCLDTN
ncbi:hypothetical protein COU77_00365 [Candidatus Peregrinibacteria bacterium CG10_big_fil_rev_8_21_14_0_10_49_16]|nr:MAG: hypothetical protein COW95_04350 [Candidatus Peregrinibacteria bacterium CG22_combo_CG10-13_8_21_14_all_49_11]PIR52439.1 MAG: hypothetical protein COU77_00365 [Candidatus Peregrinibacteria bacterium CG10_big_fil_rev_8_21_14_0_10_49_16]